MTYLPWLLLASTLTVRLLLAKHIRAGFYLDILSIPAWLTFYVGAEAWALLPIPFVFGYLDVMALKKWWVR